jgi:predicted DNA-binding transcriptional regulator YafY
MGARPAEVDLAAIRGAIRDSRKLRIAYADETEQRSRRTICPVAMVYYADVTLVAGWCELREDFRHFRVDRIEEFLLDEPFASDKRLTAEWSARQGQQAKPNQVRRCSH